jgi:cardiolipin synthase
MWNLPNLLTLGRIVLLPILLLLLAVPASWAAWTALGLYTIAAITDYLDGYLARATNQITPIGKFLDPISDKIFIGCLLMMLAAVGRLDGFWIIPALVILARELLISGLREYLGPYNIQVPVSKLAKWKTAIQMFTMGFLIVGDFGNGVLPNTLLIGQIGLAIAAALTVQTGWNYMVVGMKHMMEQK